MQFISIPIEILANITVFYPHQILSQLLIIDKETRKNILNNFEYFEKFLNHLVVSKTLTITPKSNKKVISCIESVEFMNLNCLQNSALVLMPNLSKLTIRSIIDKNQKMPIPCDKNPDISFYNYKPLAYAHFTFPPLVKIASIIGSEKNDVNLVLFFERTRKFKKFEIIDSKIFNTVEVNTDFLTTDNVKQNNTYIISKSLLVHNVTEINIRKKSDFLSYGNICREITKNLRIIMHTHKEEHKYLNVTEEQKAELDKEEEVLNIDRFNSFITVMAAMSFEKITIVENGFNYKKHAKFSFKNVQYD